MNMKIVIATGVFPPDIGGPAKYAEHLYEEFLKQGHGVSVLAFGNARRLPSGIRHLAYFFKLARLAKGADLVLALDTFSVGFPAFLAAKLFGVKVMVRVGGDFLWES